VRSVDSAPLMDATWPLWRHLVGKQDEIRSRLKRMARAGRDCKQYGKRKRTEQGFGAKAHWKTHQIVAAEFHTTYTESFGCAKNGSGSSPRAVLDVTQLKSLDDPKRPAVMGQRYLVTHEKPRLSISAGHAS